jgi:predicted esterase
MIARTISASVHGRYLYEDRGRDRVVIGFHGYGETAEVHLAELQKIVGIESWSVAAVQALHPFYTRAGEVVASWMTRLDRELAIADNIDYVQRVVAEIGIDTVVFAGFSQGASMAARAAAFAGKAAGLIMLGGDIPPDVQGATLPPTLLGRGTHDTWYTEEKLRNDLRYLGERGRSFVFDGAHEWTDAFREQAGAFLRSLLS